MKGKFGSSDPSKLSKVLIFHTENEEERNRLFEVLKKCVKYVNSSSKVFYQRGCTNLFHQLLGDWKRWSKVTPIKRPELSMG